MRVLVIDDSDGVRMFARHVLEDAGFEVVEAADGEEVVRLFRAAGADVVVTDMFMPGVDGLGVIKALSSGPAGVPLVATSGGWYGGLLDMLPMAHRLGADAVLAKPYSAEDLLAAVEGAMRGAPATSS